MQEYFIDTGDWKAFWDRWQDTVNQIPGMKEQLLERVGKRVQSEVHNAIRASGINDPRGRVKRWQNPHVGSRSGYVAVRSDSVEVSAGYKGKERLNAGALTNFLTSGHKIRGPSGRAKRTYIPRTRPALLDGKNRVRGRAFYRDAKGKAEKIALQEAEAFLKELQP